MRPVGEGIHDAVVVAVGIEVIAHETAIGIAGQVAVRPRAAEQGRVVIPFAVAGVVREVEGGLTGDVGVIEGPVRDQAVLQGGEAADVYGDRSCVRRRGGGVAQGVRKGLYARFAGQEIAQHTRSGRIESQRLAAAVDAYGPFRRLGDRGDFQVPVCTQPAIQGVVVEHGNQNRCLVVGGGEVIAYTADRELQCLGWGNLNQGIDHGHAAGDATRVAAEADPRPVMPVWPDAGDRGAHPAGQQGLDRGVVGLQPGEITQAIPGGDLVESQTAAPDRDLIHLGAGMSLDIAAVHCAECHEIIGGETGLDVGAVQLRADQGQCLVGRA